MLRRRVNPCTVPGCRNKLHGHGLCTSHLLRLEKYGDPLAHIPLGALLLPVRYDRACHGPGFCICPVSRPAPKCCVTCGYPSVHRMAPAILARAIKKAPWLQTQVVEGDEPARRSA